MTDGRRSAPHVARNAVAITDVLRPLLPKSGLVLEVASGTGEHGVHLATAFANLTWQPSDPDPAARRSIEAWRTRDGPANLRPPIELDARSASWPIEAADALICINMVHIAPWAAALGLMAGAARLLRPDMLLYLYGPFRQAKVPTAASNEAFDMSLKARDPSWGLRSVEDLTAIAGERGFRLEGILEMPANNLSIVFRRN